MTSSCRPWLLAAAVLLLLALAVVLGRFAFSPQQPPADLASTEQPAAAVATPTATTTPARPRATATPTLASRLTATATLTVTATPPAAPVAPTPGPTVAPDLALEFTTLKPNQYLGYVAQRYGVALDELVQLSGIENPDVVPIGQGLIIPHRPGRNTPEQILLPDSELLYGAGYVDFDLHGFVAQQGGRLAQVSMTGLDGAQWSGADAVERVAMRYSVGPRVLLALMEAGSGWVSDPAPQGLAADYPLGHTNGAPGLLPQLEWAADVLNHGFYGWQDRGETAIRFEDGTLARGAPGLNPGTAAVQRALAATEAVSAAQSAFGPKIAAEWSVGLRDSHFFPSERDWRAGVTVTWSLFDGFAKRHRLAGARAAHARDEAEVERTKQTVQAEVWSAHATLRETHEAIAAADVLIRDADENVRIARERYRVGAGTVNELLDAQAALARAGAVRAQAAWDYRTARATYDWTIGRALPAGAAPGSVDGGP